MNEELNKAFEQISDEHINEAASYHRPRFMWLKAIAAVLALVVAWTAIWHAFDFPPTIIFPADTTPTDSILQDSTLPSTPSAPNIPDPSDPTEPISPTISDPPTPADPMTPTPPDDPGPVILPLSVQIGKPEYPEMVRCPSSEGADPFSNEYQELLYQWEMSKRTQYDQPSGYADSLDNFWAKSIREFLSGEGNRAYSPVNVYLALAMLAETTGGNSRQQILDLLGADSITALRTQASHVWNAHYSDDGKTTSVLANSLWLDNEHQFKDDAVHSLVSNYFASVFSGDLGTEEVNEHLRTWINSQTGGLLEEQAKELELSADSIFALVSTIYFATDWDGGFSEDLTTDGIFHTKSGHLTVPFMHDTIRASRYYWGSNFGAVELELSSGSMWLILPDEGVSVDEVLAGDEYLRMTQDPYEWEQQIFVNINLSLPKFDISSQSDLIEGMKNLGITDVFDDTVSDFSPMTDTPQLIVSKIDHAVRVAVDEEGIIAAAFTVIETAPTGAPDATNEIDFTLDRPFLFVVSSHDRLPLFAGVVEQP